MNADALARLMAAWGFGPNTGTYDKLVAAYSARGRC